MKTKMNSTNRLALSAALLAAGAMFSALLISTLSISTLMISPGAWAADSAPASPAPAQVTPAKIPGVPLPNPSEQPASGAGGGGAQDLLNSKGSTARSCKDANGITVYPSDPDYKTKCATRHPRHPRVRIPIPGDT